MQEKEVKFLEEAFKKYYFDHFDLIHIPNRPSEREFGFQKFNFFFLHLLSFFSKLKWV